MQKHKIYKLWWQGIDNAPPIVKVCHESLLRNYNPQTQEIILLDKDNVMDYVKLPDYLMQKFIDGKITITHLSDIIRSMLLKKKAVYGQTQPCFIQSRWRKIFSTGISLP